MPRVVGRLLRNPFLAERERYGHVVATSPALRTLLAMGEELKALWLQSNATREQLLFQLEEWCRKAEASNIEALRRPTACAPTPDLLRGVRIGPKPPTIGVPASLMSRRK